MLCPILPKVTGTRLQGLLMVLTGIFLHNGCHSRSRLSSPPCAGLLGGTSYALPADSQESCSHAVGLVDNLAELVKNCTTDEVGYVWQGNKFASESCVQLRGRVEHKKQVENDLSQARNERSAAAQQVSYYQGLSHQSSAVGGAAAQSLSMWSGRLQEAEGKITRLEDELKNL